MLAFLLFGVIVNGFNHVVYSNHIAQCQLDQTYGNYSFFVNVKNETIKSFIVQENFTFGIFVEPFTNFDALFSLTCVDLTSNVCINYIGPCPRSIFILSLYNPFVRIMNYLNASSYFKNSNYYLRWR